jgi:hypothetical protein
MKKMKGILGLAGVLLCMSLVTNAMGETARPCADDIKKFCGEAKPGKGGIEKCLKEHETDLSAACRERRAELRKKFEEKQLACEEDVSRFCADVQPGRGGIVRCLREHEADLSSACKAALPPAGGMRK